MQNTNEQRAKLLEMIPRWQDSGLTQTAICTNNNIAYHVFLYWYGVYSSNQNSTGSFVPVKISTPLLPNKLPSPVSIVFSFN